MLVEIQKKAASSVLHLVQRPISLRDAVTMTEELEFDALKERHQKFVRTTNIKMSAL